MQSMGEPGPPKSVANLDFLVQRAILRLCELDRLAYGNLLKSSTGRNNIEI